MNNSLNHLSKNGVIVLHDCNPISKKSQVRVRPKSKKGSKWHGDVWKAFALLRMTREDLSMYVVDVNHGCGVVRKGKQKLFKKVSKDSLNYNFLKKNRKKLLKLKSTKDFIKYERAKR